MSLADELEAAFTAESHSVIEGKQSRKLSNAGPLFLFLMIVVAALVLVLSVVKTANDSNAPRMAFSSAVTGRWPAWIHSTRLRTTLKHPQ
jgi:hypothetical protein